MKKVFVSMMVATALLIGGTAYAQTDASTGATVQKECTKDGKACKEGKKGDKAGKGKRGGKSFKGNKGNRPQFNPFDGVQLTGDQQQRLQVLQQGLGPVVLDKAQQEKIKENPNLTPEQRKQLKEEKKAQKLEAKKNYLNGVKEILTPDQYVIFLENVYLYAPQQGQGKGFGNKPGVEGNVKMGKKAHDKGVKMEKGKAKADKNK